MALLARLTAAALALTLLAAPAHAAHKPKPKPEPTYTATLDCGAGPVTVISGQDMFAPLRERETGRLYEPVKWRVTAAGKTIRATKPGWHGGPTTKCGYDDGQAAGTVWVQRGHHSRHH